MASDTTVVRRERKYHIHNDSIPYIRTTLQYFGTDVTFMNVKGDTISYRDYFFNKFDNVIKIINIDIPSTNVSYERGDPRVDDLLKNKRKFGDGK